MDIRIDAPHEVLDWGPCVPRKLFLRDFGPGVTEIGPAMQRAAMQTAASAACINRALRGIMWCGVLAGGLMYSLARTMPTHPEQIKQHRATNDRSLEDVFRSTPGLKQLTEFGDWLGGLRGGQNPPPKFSAHNIPLTVHPSAWDFSHADFAPPAGQQGAESAPARPPARPEVVTVEETVNHDYKADHTVTVTVPVTIQQHIRADAAALSREIGARTERATRRALSDAMIPE